MFNLGSYLEAKEKKTRRRFTCSATMWSDFCRDLLPCERLRLCGCILVTTRWKCCDSPSGGGIFSEI